MPTAAIDWNGFALQWHHMLPGACETGFKKVGIDINKKEWSWLIDAEYHGRGRKKGCRGKLHPRWERELKKFFENHPADTLDKEAVIGELNCMKRRYDQIFSRGTQATMSCREGRRHIGVMKKAMLRTRKTKCPSYSG